MTWGLGRVGGAKAFGWAPRSWRRGAMTMVVLVVLCGFESINQTVTPLLTAL